MRRLSMPRASFQASINALFIGALIAEGYFFFEPISLRLSYLLMDLCRRSVSFLVLQIFLVLIIPFARWFVGKDFWIKTLIFLKSYRVDLFIAFLMGIFITISFNGFFLDPFRKWIWGLSMSQLGILIVTYVLLFFGTFLLEIFKSCHTQEEKPASLFLSDTAINDEADDELKFADKANKFAERVYNRGSTESLVFGLDAPWGTGKSSFLNLCQKYWLKNYEDKVIVHTFDPLRYENREHLLDKFISSLISKIKKHVFIPEIESAASKYAALLKDSKMSFSLFGLSIGLPFFGQSIDDVFENLEKVLLGVDQKIVIIIDNLDRLHLSEIKEILFTIKKAFTLPNISYVLCYDTVNISDLDGVSLSNSKAIYTNKGSEKFALQTIMQGSGDNTKIIEFLEKFINIKITLHIDKSLLLAFVKKNKDAFQKEDFIKNKGLSSKAFEGLKQIFDGNNSYQYTPFLGDLRKIKRLLNTIKILGIDDSYNFDNSDFDPKDLVNLLLIYINYPHIFRKIYETETQNKNGFFSVVTKYDPGYPKDEEAASGTALSSSDVMKYKNSIQYSRYIQSLPEEQQFLLNQVFDVSLKLSSYGNDIPTNVLTSYACFNGTGWNKTNNLEEYLLLITGYPPKNPHHKFFTNKRDEFVSGKDFDDIFADDIFSFSKKDDSHEQFWKVLVNTPSDQLPKEKAHEAINYLLSHLPEYSSIEDMGLRHTLVLYTIKLLDKFSWSDEEGTRWSNSDENIVSIAHWIFGEKEHLGMGIIEILPKSGVLGLLDLMAFRLSCCKDRGGDFYNLSRALSFHGNPKAPTSGNLRELVIEEMRELSQAVFEIFNTNYIQKGKNIFAEIDKLTLKKACGKWYTFFKTKIDLGELKKEELNTKLKKLKSTMKAFILYQLANTIVDSGIGCGFYDLKGNADQKGIFKAMNDYLFNVCFDGTKDKKNYYHFLEFLLSHSSSSISRVQRLKYQPNINESLRILDRDSLITFWKKNSIEIKKIKFGRKKVVTVNYEVSYKEALPNIFQQLDNLLLPAPSPKAPEPTDPLIEI